MKILMAIPHYSFNIVGAVRPLLKDIGKGLAKRGHQADVLSLYIDRIWKPKWKKEIFYDDGLKVIRWPSLNPIPRIKGEKSNALNIINCGAIPGLGLRKLAREYDIINFFDMIDLTFPVFSFFINIPKIYYCITLTEQFRFYKERPVWRYLLSKSSDFYLTATRQSLSLIKELGIDKSKCDYLYHGVDTEKFKPAYEKKEENTILFLSRIERRKGLKTLLEALSIVKSRITLLIVGQVSDEDYFREILSLIEFEKKKGYHKIELLGIVKEGEEKVKMYQRASIFVLPSIYEDFGIVNLESLACSTPVIASRVGGVPEIVENGVNGVLVEPGNAAEMAAAIDRLLADGALRRSMGERGREIILEKFSWDRIIESLEKIYMKVISSKAGTGFVEC